MPRRKKSPPSEVVRRSREVREEAAHDHQERFWATQAAGRSGRLKSSELCHHSDDLVQKSHQLREKLRNLRHAS
jgi:hypothetical protein